MGPNDRIIGEREPPGVHLEGAGIASPARISPDQPSIHGQQRRVDGNLAPSPLARGPAGQPAAPH